MRFGHSSQSAIGRNCKHLRQHVVWEKAPIWKSLVPKSLVPKPVCERARSRLGEEPVLHRLCVVRKVLTARAAKGARVSVPDGAISSTVGESISDSRYVRPFARTATCLLTHSGRCATSVGKEENVEICVGLTRNDTGVRPASKEIGLRQASKDLGGGMAMATSAISRGINLLCPSTASASRHVDAVAMRNRWPDGAQIQLHSSPLSFANSSRPLHYRPTSSALSWSLPAATLEREMDSYCLHGLPEGLPRKRCGGPICGAAGSASSSSSFYTDAAGGAVRELAKRDVVLPKRDSLGPGLDPDMKPEELEDSEGGGIGDIPMVWGRVHSIESFSAIDGPGIRSVMFLQGCWRRCLFCSNPDTWSPTTKETKRMSSKDIAKLLERNLPYYSGGGGVTLSGGEPLLQPDFCAAIFREAHALGISTALDTAGYGRPEEWAKVLPYTNVVLLCLKAMDKAVYHKLVGLSNTVVMKFVEAIQKYKVQLVIRFVVLPGYTDTEQEIEGLIAFAKTQPTLIGVEILPYHTLGVNKWEELGMNYPLKGVSPPSKEFMMEVKQRIENEGIKTLM
ncbi:hypothetical protein CBR_g55228 [Chara braunii]|uniref:Radical SAM core domain-containing protein n=1 Tax=Chara braunii TaxID=69332 RepID=A0A388MCR1_CHABU|nr:hypothetical protein CBR_g55228 [Chara braunii]|eukprot:GBG92347.1 hypothetical protein CBR_g55228 [Chara braunii]